jgi:hypothetical protein
MLREIAVFLWKGHRAWLIPIVLIVLLVGVLAAYGVLSGYSPFLYPL